MASYPPPPPPDGSPKGRAVRRRSSTRIAAVTETPVRLRDFFTFHGARAISELQACKDDDEVFHDCALKWLERAHKDGSIHEDHLRLDLNAALAKLHRLAQDQEALERELSEAHAKASAAEQAAGEFRRQLHAILKARSDSR